MKPEVSPQGMSLITNQINLINSSVTLILISNLILSSHLHLGRRILLTSCFPNKRSNQQTVQWRKSVKSPVNRKYLACKEIRTFVSISPFITQHLCSTLHDARYGRNSESFSCLQKPSRYFLPELNGISLHPSMVPLE